MNKDRLLAAWLTEEKNARIHGWDFSYIEGRHEQLPLPWEYRDIIKKYLRPHMRLLDMDTGGGEFLLSLGHPHENTAAIEGYAPNAALCRDVLTPLGIDLHEAQADGPLPFGDASFDIVLNRHGSFNAKEIYRILKPDRLFITQQVGAENDRELVNMLYDVPPALPYPEQHLHIFLADFEKAGFAASESAEAFRPIRFFDVGALVWFAKIIEWEFPDFSVPKCVDRLFRLQEILDGGGTIEGRVHRFIAVMQKKHKPIICQIQHSSNEGMCTP